MNNLLQILALDETKAQSVVFVNGREEAGINAVFDPHANGEIYQVFIHRLFPYEEVGSWEFDNFAAARGFAATRFAREWEMLVWDKPIDRPCEKGESCGGGHGTCVTCASGGGCGPTGACGSA